MSSPPSTEPDESSRGPERNEAGSEQPCVVNSNEEINYMEDIEDNVEMSAEGSSSGSNRNTSLLGEPSSANIEAVENATTPIEQNTSEIISEGEEVPGDALDDVVRQTTRTRRRYYRRRSGTEDSSEDENSVVPGASTPRRRGRWEEYFMSGSSSTSSLNSAHEEDLRSAAQLLQDAPTPRALQKPKPIHKWFAVKEIIGRERGAGGRWQAAERFQHRYYGSLHAVQRLELMYKLGGHRGCVNSLSFNRGGDMLLSASDDRRVLVWNWAADKRILSFDSGHTGNVFQAKFLPMSGDTHIATCGADGQVRLAVLSCFGLCKGTRQLAQHRRSTHKLATHPDTPQVFLSAGEDALVYSHDVRTSKASKLLYVRELGAKVGLYSINSNPVCSNEFIVTGEDQYIRLYDKRKTHTLLNKFCPKNLLKPDVFLHVTCAVFNYNGTEIVGSYNDDDIYLFDTRQPEGSDYVYKYEGHRNSITVKGVNFFGPRSEFIVSGSDCGNIYFWDKNTEAIVQWMRGDEEGVVNCLEPHPQVPIIATSGLDSDIKIWVPSCEQEPTLQGLKDTVVSNHTDRAETRQRRSDPYDNQQMRWLWQQIQRFEQRRANRLSERQDDDDDVVHETSETRQNAGDDNSSSSSSEEEGGPSGRPQCSPS